MLEIVFESLLLSHENRPLRESLALAWKTGREADFHLWLKLWFKKCNHIFVCIICVLLSKVFKYIYIFILKKHTH